MTKPRLEKARALFYAFQHVKKKGCAFLTQPPYEKITYALSYHQLGGGNGTIRVHCLTDTESER